MKTGIEQTPFLIDSHEADKMRHSIFNIYEALMKAIELKFPHPGKAEKIEKDPQQDPVQMKAEIADDPYFVGYADLQDRLPELEGHQPLQLEAGREKLFNGDDPALLQGSEPLLIEGREPLALTGREPQPLLSTGATAPQLEGVQPPLLAAARDSISHEQLYALMGPTPVQIQVGDTVVEDRLSEIPNALLAFSVPELEAVHQAIVDAEKLPPVHQVAAIESDEPQKPGFAALQLESLAKDGPIIDYAVEIGKPTVEPNSSEGTESSVIDAVYIEIANQPWISRSPNGELEIKDFEILPKEQERNFSGLEDQKHFPGLVTVNLAEAEQLSGQSTALSHNQNPDMLVTSSTMVAQTDEFGHAIPTPSVSARVDAASEEAEIDERVDEQNRVAMQLGSLTPKDRDAISTSQQLWIIATRGRDLFEDGENADCWDSPNYRVEKNGDGFSLLAKDIGEPVLYFGGPRIESRMREQDYQHIQQVQNKLSEIDANNSGFIASIDRISSQPTEARKTQGLEIG